MSGFEIVGLVLGVIGLVPMFKEGYVMVKEYRQRQKVKLLTGGSASTLEDTLEGSSTSVANRYDKFYSSYGTKFSNGDAISHAQLSKIVITLQAEIISALRSALAGGTLEQNAPHLNLVASQGRQEAMAILGQLAQRISTTIAPMLSTAKNTPKYLPSSRIQEIEEDTGIKNRLIRIKILMEHKEARRTREATITMADRQISTRAGNRRPNSNEAERKA
ncbi:hypothetical protein TWF106_009141 [Orbilia oligospora]|uniref:Uncharacterized protein n=1 Tax=Orbilia oligospora TaxID=2813651 RepID=A0A7C8V106_ORBOL|nr:hypothetical protein TWF106_009141 [Orbilia oligospora]